MNFKQPSNPRRVYTTNSQKTIQTKLELGRKVSVYWKYLNSAERAERMVERYFKIQKPKVLSQSPTSSISQLNEQKIDKIQHIYQLKNEDLNQLKS